MFVNKNIIVYCLFKLVHCELTQETTFDFNYCRPNGKCWN